MSVHVSSIYPLLFSHYVDACLLVDPGSGRIVEANCAAVRFLRMKRDDLVRRRLPDILAAGDAALADMLDLVRVEGQAAASVEVRVGAGQRAPSRVAARSVDTEEGSIILLTLRGAVGEPASGGGGDVTEVAKLHHRLKAFRELFFRLNNPIQELLSTVELQDNVRLKRVAEETTAVLRQLRHIEKPLAMPERPDPARTAASRRGRPCTRDSVLIVDDELSVRNLFHNILRRNLPAVGLEMANDGDTALAAFQQNHHSVVLLDLKMPKVGGEAVFVQLEAFCKAEYWQMPTVVVCTAFDGASSVQKILARDARHTCLYKPVPKDELVSVIRQRLELHALD